MWKTIALSKIDELLEDFQNFKNKGESFSEFIEVSSTIMDDGIKIPDWEWTDSLGVITPQDFENDFDKRFVEDNFEELANLWFKGLSGQTDFEMVLDCVKDEMKAKYDDWKEKKKSK